MALRGAQTPCESMQLPQVREATSSRTTPDNHPVVNDQLGKTLTNVSKTEVGVGTVVVWR